MDERDQDLSLTGRAPFRLGHARIDPPALSITLDGETRRVEAKVMQVLLALAREPGRVLSRQELEREIWPRRVVTEDAVTNAVVKLRKALKDSSRQPRVVETIAKSGYRLKIEPVPEDAPALRGARNAAPPRVRRGLLAALLLSAAAAFVAILTWRSPTEPADDAPPRGTTASIAVIPFDVLGDDPSQGYFAEGITLDLITALSHLPGLLVIASGTVFGYRDAAADGRAIAEELGVLYLIRGGVQRAGDRIRINVRLLEAANGTALWAERFDGESGALFRIQDEVVSGITAALRVRLAGPLQPRQRTGTTRSIAAYDEFLRGQERYGRRTPEDNRVARRHFERAVDLDPGFARAFAGLALVWSRLGIDGWTADPAAALKKAEALAEEAASIDPTVPQIHFVRGQVALFSGQHDRAAAAAATAIELDPNYADAHALLAWIFHYAGRPDQAWPSLGEALRRNPVPSASYRQIAGEIYFTTGRYEQAAREFEAALERNPAHVRARLWLAATRVKLGREDEAAWDAQELMAVNPEFSLSRMLLAFPLKDPQQREALTAALARLGLPE